MKVCVVNAPWETGDRWGIRAGCRFPNMMPRKHNSYVPYPFLVGYTAAFLHANGLDVLAIDGVGERCSPESFLQRVAAFSPDLLIAETATTSFRYDIALLSRLAPLLPALAIVLYGPHVSVLPEDALREKAIFAVIAGEPEQTALALANALIARDNDAPGTEHLSAVEGLIWRDPTGTIVRNAPRTLMADIDSLPYPDRTQLPPGNYHVPGFPEQVVFMYGSRGCPFRCNFCLWPQTLFEPGSYRARSGRSIAREMDHVARTYPGVRSVFFDDDTFHLGDARMNDLADELERLQVSIPWGCNARADHWNRETLLRLKKNGLFTLRIGIESGDQSILDTIRKDLDLESAAAMLRMAHDIGIQVHISFVVGLQGESRRSLEKTLRFIRSVPVDSVQFSVAVPFPGTAYYSYVEEKNLFVTKDWTKFNGYDHVVMRTDSLSAGEIMKGITTLRRKVYFSPQFIRKRLRYVRNVRDLAALSRKVIRIVAGR
jgi:anaerobic magnesium-protoporphyrin IX monomethyl ester cyclase